MSCWASLYQTAADFPENVRTVGAAKAAGLRIEATCPRCWGLRPVDLDRIIGLHGPDYSLIDRRPPCPMKPGCGGRIAFRYMGPYGLKELESEQGKAWRRARQYRPT